MLRFVLLLLILGHTSKVTRPHCWTISPPPPPFGFCCYNVRKYFMFCRKPVVCSTVARYILCYSLYYTGGCDVIPDARHLSPPSGMTSQLHCRNHQKRRKLKRFAAGNVKYAISKTLRSFVNILFFFF